MNHVFTRLVALASLWLAPSVLHADIVDDYVRAEMDRQHIPGLAYAVLSNGVMQKVAAHGLANVETGLPAQTDTIFQIQSITKTFTATAIMLLVQEQKLALADPLTKHLPDVPESWRAVTLRHLLTHTSGIKDFINEPTVDLEKDLQPRDVIESLRDRPLNFPTGEKYAYSNTGYHLLAMIIRQVTGKEWDDFLQERIFDPLGMNDTRVISWSNLVTNRAAGYVWAGGRLRNGYYIAPSILGYAGGGLRSTVLDLAKWDAALARGQIVKSAVLAEMWTPGKLNDGAATGYGLGWGVGQHRGHRLISHTGSHATGFRSVMARFVDDGLTVIVLTNQREARQMNIATGIAAFYLPGLKVNPAGEGS